MGLGIFVVLAIPSWLFRKDVGRFLMAGTVEDGGFVVTAILMLEVGAFVYFFQG